ncbi:MAG TPA: hypothetical protein VFQ85_09805 [Mycobacteriales bacterium]|jgi:hypothetical protein|nr:hypothetical protein [Mycobacteriales bacterium]
MPTISRTNARDQVAPALAKAQDTLTDTVLPAVRDALALARDKGADLLDSDAALEAKRRSVAVVKAARGETFVAPAARRWRFGLGMIAIGGGIGFAIAWVAKKLAAPVESYTTGTLPVPSGTDGGLTTFDGTAASDGAAPAGTAIEDIDLTAGQPTNT